MIKREKEDLIDSFSIIAKKKNHLLLNKFFIDISIL